MTQLNVEEITKSLGQIAAQLGMEVNSKGVRANQNHLARFIKLLQHVDANSRNHCVDNFNFSKAQLFQDLFVLSELGFKSNGYFVEFGATNGIDLSNTYLLESKFDWTGILAEPAKRWHADLNKNRNVNIEMRCVWKSSGDIMSFNETQAGELSTLDHFSDKDKHKNMRLAGKRYDVETISLTDMLDNFNAPNVMDYLSIDTEGSEFEILKSFDFNKYRFRVITCEHNHTPLREKIHDLLSLNGYQRKFENISAFDDWYVSF